MRAVRALAALRRYPPLATAQHRPRQAARLDRSIPRGLADLAARIVSAPDWPAIAPAAVAALERAGHLPARTRGYADGRREYGGLTVRYGRKGSLRVTLTGQHAGLWRDHEAGRRGGVLRLAVHVGAADSKRAAADWLRARGVDLPDTRADRRANATESPQDGRNRPNRPQTRQTRRNSPESPQRAPGGDAGGPHRRTLALLAASQAIPPDVDHPARRWKSGALWPAAHAWPPWMRWLPADAAAWTRCHDGRPGPAMAGALIVPVAPLAAWIAAAPDWPRRAVTGCQTVHLAADGGKAWDMGGLDKRSHGRITGAVIVCGLIDPAHGVTLAESAANALALAARFRPASIATLGTAGLAHPATVAALADVGGVTVYPDLDPVHPASGQRPGDAAATALQAALERHGATLRRVDLPADWPDGSDVADLAERDGLPPVDADVLDGWRGVFDTTGLPPWESARHAYAVALDCGGAHRWPR